MTIYEILIVFILSTTSASFFRVQKFSTAAKNVKIHSRLFCDQRNDNKEDSLANVTTQENADTNSVHLKLTKQFNYAQSYDDKINQTETRTTPLLEYVSVNDSSVVLASIGSNRTILELFGYHIFNKNLTLDPMVSVREVSVIADFCALSILTDAVFQRGNLTFLTTEPPKICSHFGEVRSCCLKHGIPWQYLARNNPSATSCYPTPEE